ncbi:hypothetical protein [Nocardia sp. NPDC057440]|uniref:hypothetical protein n=1 Tax=Nocardia sp. NPDC057440 TaxID=3346134 RepID=UPI00366DF7D1
MYDVQIFDHRGWIVHTAVIKTVALDDNLRFVTKHINSETDLASCLPSSDETGHWFCTVDQGGGAKFIARLHEYEVRKCECEQVLIVMTWRVLE